MTARTGRRSSCTVDVGISLIEDLAISVDAFSRVVLPDHLVLEIRRLTFLCWHKGDQATPAESEASHTGAL